ncbi:MAG: DNA alkylation repair protein [Erysipelotrichaceae bacterium]|nr:DNA alkylation repair protein [Erysipelotrichaceae bacterium]
MNLVKDNWTKEDRHLFNEYLMSFSKGKEKGEWEKRIVNTSLPCIAVPSPDVKKITKEIHKGNYLSFIDLWIWDNFTDTAIIGGLICLIKDFDLMKKYLLKFVHKADCWATVDLLKFNIKDNNKKQYLELAKELIKDNHPFTRRAGVTILFKMVDDDLYINEIFKIMNSFYNEDEYYVNMVVAWLFAECFTKQRQKTLEFLNTHRLNKFTINKGISKCRDSFRVSKEDKEMLLKYRQ